MGRALALVMCLATAACLDAPQRGDEGDTLPGTPGHDVGDAPDAGGAPAAACADGAAADIAYPAEMTVSLGQNGIHSSGLLVVINTGDVPLDLAGLEIGLVTSTDPRVQLSAWVASATDTIPPGTASGAWDFDQAVLLDELDEPWNDTTSPSVAYSLDAAVDTATAVVVQVSVRLGERTAVAPIEMYFAGGGDPYVGQAGRVPLSCAPE